MNAARIDDVYIVAERFMSLATDLIAKAEGGSLYEFPKESGALRRASMDLTRALADMRRPN